jgi:hypothetical protein
MALCHPHRVVRSASRSEAIASLGERWVNLRLQDLPQSLLDQAIRRYPQFPHPASRLRDLNTPRRLGPVAAAQ